MPFSHALMVGLGLNTSGVCQAANMSHNTAGASNQAGCILRRRMIRAVNLNLGDEDVDEDEEDEELGTPKAKRKSRKKDEEDEEEYDDLAHRKIVADEDEDIQPGSRAHEAEKRLRFEKKKSMKKERWSAGGLDKDLNGRLNVDRLRKTPKLTRAEGIQGSLSSHNGGGSSSAAELARARAMRDET